MAEVGIRPGVAADLDAITRVFHRAFRHGYRGVLADDVVEGIDRVWPAERLARQFGLPGVRYLLAEHDSVVVGFTRVTLDDEDPDVGCVGALYVDPDHAGRGIGRALLDAAFAVLAQQGCVDVTLWVFEDNVRARRLYERAGLVPDGDTHVSDEFRAKELRLRRRLSAARQ